MPLVGNALPSAEWRTWDVSGFKLGDLLGAHLRIDP